MRPQAAGRDRRPLPEAEESWSQDRDHTTPASGAPRGRSAKRGQGQFSGIIVLTFWVIVKAYFHMFSGVYNFFRLEIIM
jgi:hypothetical protein